MRALNLGILAHVDAGKTTLTERLLYAAGVIAEVGSVDRGTTRTDTLELERQRGITIKAAVASFPIGDLTVNLVDTPGHPDFIAEVERSLRVLDGAVLVVSAVEGVQPQSRVLMRALQRLRVPTLIFVNKIDRRGADPVRVADEITAKLTREVVGMGTVIDAGAVGATFVPSRVTLDRDAFLVLFGSAITGAGVDDLMRAIAELLPATEGDPDARLAGRVFKVDRDHQNRKVAYVCLRAGTMHVRDRVPTGRASPEKITAIRVFEHGKTVSRPSAVAGEIAQVWGLTDVRIGDTIGVHEHIDVYEFPPPTLETVVVPANERDGHALREALTALAEQDPLINVRQDDTTGEISVSLYGEVQKEVIQATLANDFGVNATFRPTTTIYVERPSGAGEAIELLQDDANPYSATIGLRIEPAAAGTGIEFRLDVDPRTIPLHIYKTRDRFVALMREHVQHALLVGLSGWQVTDCAVTMNACGYYASDGPRKPTMPTPRTTAADFRHLTPRALRRALERAGTVVCEPMVRVSIETPTATVGPVLSAAARLGAAVEPAAGDTELSTVTATIAAARVQDLRRHVADLTGGEGVLEGAFAGYRPVTGAPPVRRAG